MKNGTLTFIIERLPVHLVMRSFVVYMIFVFIFTSVFNQTIGHLGTQHKSCTNDTGILQCYAYIPTHIPDGISEVVLHSLSDGTVLAESVFDGPGWNTITSLTIDSRSVTDDLMIQENSFVNLVGLESLGLHISHTKLESGAFNGLLNVTTLDMTNSIFIHTAVLNGIILHPGTFPKLEKLVLIRLGIDYGLSLNNTFWKRIETRPVSYLDISYVQASELDINAMLKHCTKIRTLRTRGLNVRKVYGGLRNLTKLPNLEVLDFSECDSIRNVACQVPTLFDIPVYTVHTRNANCISNIRELYLDNICGLNLAGSRNHVLKNISNIRLESSEPWNLKLLSFNGNSLTYFDVQFIGEYLTLETLFLAQNDMEYFNPKSLLTVAMLKHLDLSDNRLGLMSRHNGSIFQSALVHLPELKNLSLARNELTFLPDHFFANNDRLQIINLAGNFLEQVHFTVRNLQFVDVLNLSYNSIRTLSELSRTNLNSVISFNKTKLQLKGNPISCNACQDHDFIVWLVAHKHSISDWEHLSCINEMFKHVSINKHVVIKLTNVCKIPISILIWSTLCISCVFVVVTSIAVVVKCLKKRGYTKRRKQLIHKLANQEPGFEFAIFLGHCDHDFKTVICHMLPPLEQKLQEIVGVGRDLVFLGDKHYQVGFPIFEETMRSIRISCAVIFVVSESFCRSSYCQIELQQA